MKRGLIVILFMLAFMMPTIVSAIPDNCALDVTLINQNPYPALPGEYVELVFQVGGVESGDCQGANFKFVEEYPFSLEEGINPAKSITDNTWLLNYENAWMIGYRVLIDQNALNENYELAILYGPGVVDDTSLIRKVFNISIEDVVVDFEVYVNDYDINTKELTFELLNIGESDIEALTIEIPKQELLSIKGANRKVVGDLDSNEYTTASFEATPSEEGDILLSIFYTDKTNTRRSIDKIVHFDPIYFEGLTRDQKSKPVFAYIVVIILVAWLIWSRVKKHKRKKEREKKLLKK
jgi:hypothetical protein